MTGFIPSLIRLPQPAIPALLRVEGSAPPMHEVEMTDGTEDVAGIEASCGTLAHLYMELMAQEGVAQWPAERVRGLEPAMRRWLQRQGHAEKEFLSGAQRVVQALTVTLASADGQWVLQAHMQAASELALAMWENGQLRHHVIDRTFVAEGARWVVDYKSARLRQASSEAAETWRPQLERYARLFREEGLPVRKAVFFLASGKLVEID